MEGLNMKRDDAEKTLNSIFSKDEMVTPEELIAKVIQGDTHIHKKGEQRRISKQMIEAAKIMLPYRLPRLNAVDADVRNTDVPHEQWVEKLAADDAENPINKVH
jgi:hypothetical protein